MRVTANFYNTKPTQLRTYYAHTARLVAECLNYYVHVHVPQCEASFHLELSVCKVNVVMSIDLVHRSNSRLYAPWEL